MKLLVLALIAACALGLKTSLVLHPKLHKSSLFAASGGVLDKMSMLNAEMLAVKEAKVTDGGKVASLPRVKKEIMKEKPAVLARLLERDGCISIPKVMAHESCDALLAFINSENDKLRTMIKEKGSSEGDEDFDKYFGGVNCRGITKAVRQDMFLPLSNPIVRNGLQEALQSLQPLLEHTVTLDGTLHELSSFIGDAGSPRQCVHADTIYLPCPQYPTSQMKPLYTVFVALQDITEDMGNTIFYPRTHTEESHKMWNLSQRKADTPTFLSGQPAMRSSLKKGDVSIFDSRLLHAGMANGCRPPLDRRVLFYFTLSEQSLWPLAGGLHGANSIRAEDRGLHRVSDFL